MHSLDENSWIKLLKLVFSFWSYLMDLGPEQIISLYYFDIDTMHTDKTMCSSSYSEYMWHRIYPIFFKFSNIKNSYNLLSKYYV